MKCALSLRARHWRTSRDDGWRLRLDGGLDDGLSPFVEFLIGIHEYPVEEMRKLALQLVGY